MTWISEVGDRLLPEIVDGRHAGVPMRRAHQTAVEVQGMVVTGAQLQSD